MGCRSSRLDAADVSPAAALCRERRDLLRAAAERRAQLAAAHAAYFRALPRVADALARFASHHHAATPPGSPVLTLPPSDPGDHPAKKLPNADETPHTGSGHSHIHFQDDDDISDGTDADSSHDACAGPGGCTGGHAEIPQPTPAVHRPGVGAAPPDHGHQPQERQVHQHQPPPHYQPVPAMPGMPWEGHSQERQVHQPQHYQPVPSMPGVPWDGGHPQERQLHQPTYQYQQPVPAMPEMPWEYPSSSYNYNPSYPSFPNPTFLDDTTTTFPRYHYMKASSTPANTVYQDPYGHDATMSYMGYSYGYNNPMYGVPVPPEGDRPPPEDPRSRDREPAPPPPMPVPETSPWDFFNPFDAYEPEDLPQLYKGNAGYGGSNGGSFTSSPNSSEVRAREGIPELEEETELESMRESVKARKAAAESTASNNRIDDVAAAKVKESMERKQDCEIESVGSASVADSGEESVCSCDNDHAGDAKPGGPVPVPVTGGDDQGNVKKVSSAEHSSMVFGEDVRMPEIVGTRDVAEVVEEIKEQFNSVASCGEDVARILEVGRMRYKSRKKILRLIFSRMIGTFALLFSSISEPPVKNMEQSAINSSKRNQNPSKRFDFVSDIELNTLSATMDTLYVWEKRLHKEIMEEERLRITYEREWKHLKELDATGAEPYKIDATRASIKTLLTRINIAMRSAKVISRRIHILRDNELHPHLVTLIQGLIRMWRFIFECHRKQFRTILETKSHILIPKNGPERSSSKVTLELEMELLNWCSCFRNWILSQKAYIETLNGWLLKWLPQEKEETADGVAPFSPGRLGAPAVFITANDWCQAMNRIPEGTVMGAMEAFAVNVHILWERQDEEQQEKLKAQYLSRDFAKRLKSLQKEHGLQGHLEADKPVLPTIANNGRAVDSRMVALDTLHKRLDEQKARHEETVKQIREASATDLKAGLAPIFEALESFTHETLRGYENVRIPTESAGA